MNTWEAGPAPHGLRGVRLRDEAGLIGLLVLLTFLGWALQSSRTSGAGEAEVVSADSDLALEAIALGEVGLPLYPGATLVGQARQTRAAGWATRSAVLTTPDSLARVRRWYRAQLAVAPAPLDAEQARTRALFQRTVTVDQAVAHDLVLLQTRGGAESVVRITLQRRVAWHDTQL